MEDSLIIGRTQVEPDTTYWFCSFLLIYKTTITMTHLGNFILTNVQTDSKSITEVEKIELWESLAYSKIYLSCKFAGARIISSVFSIKDYSPCFCLCSQYIKFEESVGVGDFQHCLLKEQRWYWIKKKYPWARVSTSGFLCLGGTDHFLSRSPTSNSDRASHLHTFPTCQ